MYVAIIVMFHAGYLTTPGIVAVVARHVGVILWPTDKISIFAGYDGSPWIYCVSKIVLVADSTNPVAVMETVSQK